MLYVIHTYITFTVTCKRVASFHRANDDAIRAVLLTTAARYAKLCVSRVFSKLQSPEHNPLVMRSVASTAQWLQLSRVELLAFWNKTLNS